MGDGEGCCVLSSRDELALRGWLDRRGREKSLGDRVVDGLVDSFKEKLFSFLV